MFNYFQNRQRKKLREEWLNPKSWEREFSSISTLFELTCHNHGKGKVDDQTWNDLDMNSIFRKVDTTMTSVGQQYLYRKLRLLENPNGSLERDYQVAALLQNDRDTREELQLSLLTIKQGDAKSVTKTLFGNFPVFSLSKLALLSWSAFSLATIIIALAYGGSFVFLIFPVVIANFSLSRYFERISDGATYVLYYLYNLVSVSARITRLKISLHIPACELLKENRNSIGRVRKVLKLVSMSQNHESMIVNNAMYLLNLIFPYDLIVYSFSMKFILQETDVMKICFCSIGSIDTSIATASYINRNSQLCNPELTDLQSIDLQDAYHPLVQNYVSNSFSTTGSSALITGSNMAGKTTFIKTIGVNLIFARTLWICHASRAQLPVIDVYSSIKTEDGLETGKSFYFLELERLNIFLKLTGEGGGCLFLIDEIYRGTNTVERIAGAAAVLQELAINSLVFVTTHDIELVTYLGDQYAMWYFEETGSKTQPFDYKLKSGVCKTRNALKLMANMGYPEHITMRAKSIAHDME